MSVDENYGSHDEGVQGMKDAMKDKGVSLTCAMAPGGFSDTGSRFGITGYDNFLVGPDGKVIATDVWERDFEGLIR